MLEVHTIQVNSLCIVDLLLCVCTDTALQPKDMKRDQTDRKTVAMKKNPLLVLPCFALDIYLCTVHTSIDCSSSVTVARLTHINQSGIRSLDPEKVPCTQLTVPSLLTEEHNANCENLSLHTNSWYNNQLSMKIVF